MASIRAKTSKHAPVGKCARRPAISYSVSNTSVRCIRRPATPPKRIDIFYAEVGDAADAQDPDEDEFVESVSMTPQAFSKLIQDGQIQDAKSLGGWLMFEKSPFYPSGASD